MVLDLNRAIQQARAADSHERALLRYVGEPLKRSVRCFSKCFCGRFSTRTSTAKEEVEALLSKLPDDCSIEDIQYHLYVIEKVRKGLEVADSQGPNLD